MLKTLVILFLGIALVVAGTAVTTYKGFTFTTAQRQLVELGPLRAGTEQSNWTIAVPPIVGGALLAGGTILILVGAFRKRTPRPPDQEHELPAGRPDLAHTESLHG